MVGPIVAGCAFEEPEGDDVESVTQAASADLAVYSDTVLVSPWRSWSWSTAVDVASVDAPLVTGSKSQIKANVQSTGGALSLAHSSGDLLVTDFDSVSFSIRSAKAGSVSLFVEPLAGTAGGVRVSVPVTTTWTTRTVTIDSLKGSLSKFGKVNFSGSSGQSFYIDDIKLLAKKSATPVPSASSSSSAPAPSAPASSAPPSTLPSPLTVTKNNVVTLQSAKGPYYLYVPNSYDASHQTPTKLLVWMHGCGGVASGDAWVVSPGGTQSWLTVSIGGRDGGCWNVGTDSALVIAALDDVEKRVNVDPRRVVIGGYSSGGDLAYRTAFYNTRRFAGLIAENTSPFRDTGSSQVASLAAAASGGWKLNVAHLAHLSDTVYPIAGVRLETTAVQSAGFPLTRIERPGTHWDADTASSGTDYDRRTYLLGYLDAGWLAPQ